MAAKVGISAVSYGIGVQNRYSAFLDEDDGFGSPAIHLTVTANIAKTVSVENKKSSVQKQNGKIKSGTKQEPQQRVSTQASAGRKGVSKSVDANKRNPQQPKMNQQQSGGSQQLKQMDNKNSNAPSNGIPANGRQIKVQPSNGASNPQGTKENQPRDANNQANATNGRSNHRGPKNQRYFNRSRQVAHRDEEKHGPNTLDPFQANGVPSTDDEKRRRQQKRANDLRFKDPEKKEARRSQSSNNNLNANDEQQSQQQQQPQHQSPSSSGNPNGRPRVQKNRRDGEKGENVAGRGFRGGRGRPRRSQGEEGVSTAVNGERKGEGVPHERRRNDGERSQRNRNGFGRGSGSRGGDWAPRTDGGQRNQERSKPIPNFSDKSDFPSLAT